MADRNLSKFTEKPSTSKSLQFRKATEQFNRLTPDHRHLLLTMPLEDLKPLEELETSLFYNFVLKEKLFLSIPIDFYHGDYMIRALAKFHGINSIDFRKETNLYAERKVDPSIKLVDYLQTVFQEESESNEQ